MTITLFQKQDLRGDSAVISKDEDDLRDLPIGRNPSSMRMTSDDDKILLFKNDDWRGGVMFRRGAQTIDNFGAPREGGRNTFGNNIASVRVIPNPGDQFVGSGLGHQWKAVSREMVAG